MLMFFLYVYLSGYTFLCLLFWLCLSCFRHVAVRNCNHHCLYLEMGLCYAVRILSREVNPLVLLTVLIMMVKLVKQSTDSLIHISTVLQKQKGQIREIEKKANILEKHLFQISIKDKMADEYKNGEFFFCKITQHIVSMHTLKTIKGIYNPYIFIV